MPLLVTVPVAEDDCYRNTATCHQHGDRWEIRELAATDEFNDYLKVVLTWGKCVASAAATFSFGTGAIGQARYVSTSLDGRLGPEALLRCARRHWEIENQLRYVRDVTLGENTSAVRKGSAAPGDGHRAQRRTEPSTSCRGKQDRSGLSEHRLVAVFNPFAVLGLDNP